MTTIEDFAKQYAIDEVDSAPGIAVYNDNVVETDKYALVNLLEKAAKAGANYALELAATLAKVHLAYFDGDADTSRYAIDGVSVDKQSILELIPKNA